MIPLGREATLDDLWEVEGKAELIDGEIVPMTGTSLRHGEATGRIRDSLRTYRAAHGGGRVISEGVGFVLQTPRTQMFIPDVAWWTGEAEDEDEFVYGAPDLAVEVRSKGDYGPAAERAMAIKRAHYFSGGTRIVWDVDVMRAELIRVYRASDPEDPAVYGRGAVAEAEPAVPGWRFPVDELFG